MIIILILVIALVALIAIGIQHHIQREEAYEEGVEEGKALQAAEDTSNELLLEEEAIKRGHAYWRWDASKAKLVFTWTDPVKHTCAVHASTETANKLIKKARKKAK